MKRLFYVTTNIDDVDVISDDLHGAGVTDWHFHVMGRDTAGISIHHLHGSNMLHETDLIHSGMRGALVGGLLGFIPSSLLLAFTELGTSFPLATLLVPVVMFGLFGAWEGGLIGISSENYQIRRFHQELENGQYLMIIDVKPEMEQTVRTIMANRHQEAEMAGTGSTMINPFESDVSSTHH